MCSCLLTALNLGFSALSVGSFGCCVMCDILRAKMLTIIITFIVKLNVGLLIVDLVI